MFLSFGYCFTLGCCCFLHASFFIFMVSLELIVGIGGAVLSAWIGRSSELRIQFYRNTTFDDEGSKYTGMGVWDNLQSENQCCGVDGPQDYSVIHREIPVSCCARAHPLREGNARRHLHATCLAERTYYTRGCEEVMRQKKQFTGNVFIATGIIFTLAEIISVGLALWMATAIRYERRKLQANLQAHFES